VSDRIIAGVALATLIAFLATIPIFVPDIDLIIVVVFVCVLAAADFWQSLRTRPPEDSD